MISQNVTRPVVTGGCPPVGIQLEGLILPPLLMVDVILGLLGNVVALWIFSFKLKSWNPNNLFLFNLVIADFLALVSLPLRIDALLRRQWLFGDAMCRINLFLMFSNRSASIALMTVVAFYRYFKNWPPNLAIYLSHHESTLASSLSALINANITKVVHPHHRVSRMTKHHAALVSAFVWLLVISPRIPMLAYNHIKVSGNTTQCFFFTSYKEASKAIIILVGMHRILTVLEFFIPLAMLVFCSIRIFRFLKKRQLGNREKVQKAMRVCVAIVGVFMLCFFPTTLTTIGVWAVRSYRPQDCNSFYIFTQINIVSLGLNFLNSALDPIIYVFSSTMFRTALCASLPHFLRCQQVTGDQEASSLQTQSTVQQELKSIGGDKGSEDMDEHQHT